jgi:hypothetical protein
MPNPKPSRTVADTAELGARIDQAHRGLPEVTDRKELLLGTAAGKRETAARQAADRAGAVADASATLTGVYEPGELERLREDWPE